MVRTLWRHREAGRNARPTCRASCVRYRFLSNRLSEIPCRVSSDLHEWRNDLGTVSTRDSAKLQCE
jgi:hypothetical protein